MTGIFSDFLDDLLITMKSFLLVVLAFVCLGAVNSWKPPNYMDYKMGVIFSKNSQEQTGSVTELNIHKGLISSKTLELAGFLYQNENMIPSGDSIIGRARVPNDFKDWKKMTFVWNGSAGASVEVSQIMFIPDMDVNYVGRDNLNKWTKHFCHDGPIKSGEQVTFKLC